MKKKMWVVLNFGFQQNFIEYSYNCFFLDVTFEHYFICQVFLLRPISIIYPFISFNNTPGYHKYIS